MGHLRRERHPTPARVKNACNFCQACEASEIPATLQLLIQAASLAVFGVGFESAFGALEARIPHEIHRAPSFTWALLGSRPLFWLPALLALGLAGWSLTAEGRRRIGWSRFDGVGGLRWVTFGIMLALAWPYGAHPYNHYYDQAHLLDRALLFFLLGATLHSPLWLPFFALEVVMSRVQILHPVSLVTPIVDEVPFRVLGVIAGFGLWSFAAAELRALGERRRRGGVRLPPIEAHVLVFAMLCLFASYYVYAGVGKLALGEQPFDWVAESHMDNLFVGAYLNGWNASLSEPAALALAGFVRRLSLPIAGTSLALELGMLFVLTGRRPTFAILAGIIGMHLGVLAVTGVFFWTWALVAACVLVWLIVQRNKEAVRRLHAPAHAVLSVLLIAALTFAFG